MASLDLSPAAVQRLTSRAAVSVSARQGSSSCRHVFRPAQAPARRHCRPAAAAATRRALVAAAAAAAGSAEGASPGDYVEAHYTIKTPDGEVFDSSHNEGGRTAQFVLGSENLVAGFHQAVGGLKQGESRAMVIRPDDAYGSRREELKVTVPAAQAPEGLKPGMVVQLTNGMPAIVVEVGDEGVTIDANHPLAGKELTFEVEVTKLIPAAQLEKATFGAGCFWGIELAFQRVPGVVQTAVGYSNGQTKNPTYEQVCAGDTGHAEVVQLIYAPAEVSYAKLLDLFWDRHDPTQLNAQGGDVGTQYRSGIYWHTEEQREVAEASKAARNAALGGKVVTEIEQVSNYYPAEEYHQQYLARGGRFGQGQNAEKGCTDPIRCYG